MNKILIMMLAAFAVFALVSCEEEPVVEPLAKDPKGIIESMEPFFGIAGVAADGDLAEDAWAALDGMVEYDTTSKAWVLTDAFKTNSTITFDSKTGKYTVTSEDCSFVFMPDEYGDAAFLDFKDNETGARYVYEESWEESDTTYSCRERYFADFCGYTNIIGTAEYIEDYYEDDTKETNKYTYIYNMTYNDGEESISLACKVNTENTDFDDPQIDDVYNITVENYTYNGVKYDPDFVELAFYLAY